MPSYDDVPLTEEASVSELVRVMYPNLNERGVANYTRFITRLGDPDFQAEVAARKARGECMLQPRIAEGTPWVDDCLTHECVGDIAHHFAVNPGADTD